MYGVAFSRQLGGPLCKFCTTNRCPHQAHAMEGAWLDSCCSLNRATPYLEERKNANKSKSRAMVGDTRHLADERVRLVAAQGRNCDANAVGQLRIGARRVR